MRGWEGPAPGQAVPAAGALGPRCRTGGFPRSLPTPPARLPYVPRVPPTALLGKVTASTFALERPRCVFDGHADASDAVWLAVAFANASAAFRNPLSRTAFQGFPDPVRAYMTLNATLANYPCPKPAGEITVLRVGSETSCAQDVTRPTCNGPLPSPGPYRVKFLALEGSVPVAETGWSKPIKLREGTAARPAPAPSPHAGMIAITTILSILFAILLAGLVAMLVFWSTFSKPESVTVRRYNTHHVYDQPAARL
uniref:Uroplakin 3B n=1 Tax=Catharus ustulatus TaxID=91951 RepID=A0A8C3U9P2_CATUS